MYGKSGRMRVNISVHFTVRRFLRLVETALSTRGVRRRLLNLKALFGFAWDLEGEREADDFVGVPAGGKVDRLQQIVRPNSKRIGDGQPDTDLESVLGVAGVAVGEGVVSGDDE